MVLKEKIAQAMMDKNTRKSDTIDRNIQIVQTYFGLGSQMIPTLQSVADEFNIRTRERVRQIIEDQFSDRVKLEEINVAMEISELINSKTIFFMNSLINELINVGLTEQDVSIKGILNLLQMYGLCKNYDLYNIELNRASKVDIENSDELFILEGAKRDELYKTLKRIKTLPGMQGMCNIYDVSEKEKIKFDDIYIFKYIIAQSKDSWIYEIDQENCWYMFENRDNIIINSLEKIVNLVSNVKIETLAETLHCAILKRTFEIPVPSKEIIKQYIYKSKYILVKDEYAYLNVQKSVLTEIENDILSFFKNIGRKIGYYPELKDFLQTKGYSKEYYDKAIYHSSFIYIDKSLGKKNYRLILIDSFSSDIGLLKKDDYHQFKQRLKELSGTTDIPATIKARKEQYILREWLFRNKKFEECAICGRKFSSMSLVVAHKKKRSLCSEGERTDPYIVMPLCVFGCDFLYENGFVEISSGEIIIHPSDILQEVEMDYLKIIQGTRINKRWLEGSNSYFNRTPQTSQTLIK